MKTGNIFEKRLIETPFVYHYTSVEAIFSILEGYRINGRDALPFRAGCIYNSNDPREMELGYEVVKAILPQYEKCCAKSMNLSEVYSKSEYEDQCKKLFFQRPKDGLVEMSTVPYTISFSCKRDFLPMWSMYGNNKRGGCLKFNLGYLIDSLNTECCCSFVHYEGDKDNVISDYLLPQLYKTSVLLNDKKMLSINDKIQELSLICDCISPFVKCDDWGYESEFRIVSKVHYRQELNDKSFNSIPLTLPKFKVFDYDEIPINPAPLDEIIIGPLANYNVLEHVLRNELKECLLNHVKITPSSIQINN